MVAAILTASCGGCGSSDRSVVTGHVIRADGSPLALARVIAVSSDGDKTAYASTDTDGSYEITLGSEARGIPPGTYSVYLIEDRGVEEGKMKRTIAKKYTDPNTSGLSIDVVAGESKVFDITTDPP
ncbi:carboxypeptidase-like regulatory domain-containing protein [Bythopirellula polymerisocia]|uniref:Carboxypeptidase regulatory-like domain-containing protein n=1 Tax=Bythopirellula polymerisocia TaxID=2528003 RepID=A0A5C6D3V0_9BACT|nr:carboxypeptidase-like regulatory domain-containing protein [Bythopirellula polymerisocia]TWU30461.1 hypothetical protein Pla144_12480 [Bythopirellula polymerisocia]